MGFTPLEGLVMATRSGSVDPGVILWLQRERGLSADEIDDALQHRSGLLGLSGETGDLREILRLAGDGDPHARLAVDVYLHRLCAGIASMAASLGGLDVLVFTGGVGEHAAEIRSAAAAGLHFLGVALDPDANTSTPATAGAVEVDITAAPAASPAPPVRTLVIPAREDLEIATEVRTLLRPD
jgi:acetate kinase